MACRDDGMLIVEPLLEILRSTAARHPLPGDAAPFQPWLTLRDLAIWLYGHDDEAEVEMIRTNLWRLRRRGYRLETRKALWANERHGSRGGASRGYRLVEEE